MCTLVVLSCNSEFSFHFTQAPWSPIIAIHKIRFWLRNWIVQISLLLIPRAFLVFFLLWQSKAPKNLVFQYNICMFNARVKSSKISWLPQKSQIVPFLWAAILLAKGMVIFRVSLLPGLYCCGFLPLQCSVQDLENVSNSHISPCWCMCMHVTE